MKWIFLLALLMGAPALTFILRANPRYLVPTCFGLGLSMFALAPGLWIAPIPWPGWPGPVQGLEVSFVDAVSLALIFSTSKVPSSPALKAAMALLLVAIIISSFGAGQLLPVLFYVWQLARSVLLFVAIARVCFTVGDAPIALLAGLGMGLTYEALLAAYQFHSGVFRPGGNLGHSNFLGLTSDFVIPPVFALMIGTRRLFWPALVSLAGFCIAIVGGSRATLGLFAAGLLLTVAFSLYQKVTPRKLAFAAGAALFLLTSAPVMWWSYNQRTHQDTNSSDQQRSQMKLAASMIISDHPLGVGADQYVIVANMGGYSQRAGVAWNEDSRAAPVHDTYYLVAAELGFLGLLALLCILGGVISQAFRLITRPIADDAMSLAPGLLAGVIIVAIHLSFEFVFMYFIPHYLLAISAGVIGALTARSKMAPTHPLIRVARPAGGVQTAF